jgi:hypothetical protein
MPLGEGQHPSRAIEGSTVLLVMAVCAHFKAVEKATQDGTVPICLLDANLPNKRRA